ncbi:MAG: PH domain-containing protein [Chitinophagales bacterium]
MEQSTQPQDLNVDKAIKHLKSVLVSGESLDAWAVQVRLFALTHRRMLIAATTGRFIVIKRSLFGGFDMNDFRWQDLGDVKLKVGVFGANIYIKKFGSTDLAMNKGASYDLSLTGFEKDQTENIYRLAQGQDQAWREKRRVRELEELRAKSGGYNLNTMQTGIPEINNSSEDSLSRLQKAKAMLDNKLITDSEFETIKARIISGL